ncbi:MAG: hypothetical protein Q8P24_03195 [Desulfobacterales bacterium]|nr:hypothetical protein [Desulfobacterales bacterium]
MWVRIIPFIFSFLLLAAHFLRYGHDVWVGISLLTPLLLLIRKRWIIVLARWLSYGAAALWLHTIYILVFRRIQAGAPWLRMTLILAGVAVLAACAGHLLNSDAVKRDYR